MSQHHQPLPERVRPQSFESFVGQPHLWSHKAPLRKLVEQDAVGSVIFWGPPGVGKTTLARLIANATQCPVEELSAVHASVKDLRAVFAASQQQIDDNKRPTLLFLDEVHRLSKSQQDVLLPALESGIIRFIGATTENPSFEVNQAILSRSLAFKFEPLEIQETVQLLEQALGHAQAKLPCQEISPSVMQRIAAASSGDGRQAINLLNAVCHAAADAKSQKVDEESVEALMEQILRSFDKAGEQHYDTISAFIKSIRGSHPDAALHYLAKMLDGGEDPMFIARRLVIAASEDIGNANPTGLLLANATLQSVHQIGMPEARIILAQTTTYLAASPKSNRAYAAINAALDDVKRMDRLEVPMQLRNAPTKFMKSHGYGKNYQYAHDQQEAARNMKYMPDALAHRRYYEPSPHGVERQLSENLKHLRPIAD